MNTTGLSIFFMWLVVGGVLTSQGNAGGYGLLAMSWIWLLIFSDDDKKKPKQGKLKNE